MRCWECPELICGVNKINIFLQCYWSGSPWMSLKLALCCPEQHHLGWTQVSALAGLKPTEISLVRFLSVLSEQIVSTVSLLILIVYSPKKVLSFSFKVTMFLHYLWVGPLQAVAVTALLWMEIGMPCLAGMAVLIILLLLQSCFGKLFSSLR